MTESRICWIQNPRDIESSNRIPGETKWGGALLISCNCSSFQYLFLNKSTNYPCLVSPLCVPIQSWRPTRDHSSPLCFFWTSAEGMGLFSSNGWTADTFQVLTTALAKPGNTMSWKISMLKWIAYNNAVKCSKCTCTVLWTWRTTDIL